MHEDTSASLKFNIYFFPICVQNGFNKNEQQQEKNTHTRNSIQKNRIAPKKIASFVTIHVEFKFFTGMFKQHNGKWINEHHLKMLLKSMCVVDVSIEYALANNYFRVKC